jgi:hypothetical protein
MHGHGGAPGRRCDAIDRPDRLELRRNLDAEVDVHSGEAMAGAGW